MPGDAALSKSQGLALACVDARKGCWKVWSDSDNHVEVEVEVEEPSESHDWCAWKPIAAAKVVGEISNASTNANANDMLFAPQIRLLNSKLAAWAEQMDPLSSKTSLSSPELFRTDGCQIPCQGFSADRADGPGFSLEGRCNLLGYAPVNASERSRWLHESAGSPPEYP